MRPIDLVAPVDKVRWLIGPEARRRQIELVWSDPGVAVRVHADPDEVQQITLNLTLNALQATRAGGRVEIAVGPDGSLTVSDTGTGMAPEVRARAFEPFFTTRVEAGGTGLGLAVVKSLADRHRAEVRLQTRPGIGTEVRVIWPEAAA
ncbi:MAG: ATP-binding protein [Alphaproteobacteria bacterium]|nr:ATP-binding protein [Alphaproteobacteria bacterium]